MTRDYHSFLFPWVGRSAKACGDSTNHCFPIFARNGPLGAKRTKKKRRRHTMVQRGAERSGTARCGAIRSGAARHGVESGTLLLSLKNRKIKLEWSSEREERKKQEKSGRRLFRFGSIGGVVFRQSGVDGSKSAPNWNLGSLPLLLHRGEKTRNRGRWLEGAAHRRRKRKRKRV